MSSSSEDQDQRIGAHISRLMQACTERYGVRPALVVAAPGRVNLIGEHTDYNEGFVLPVAIDRHVLVAATPRVDRLVRVYAADFDETAEFSLDAIEKDSVHSWSNYERGVAWVLQDAGYELRGADLAITGDVPIGSGLSSSAAIELATATAFQALADLSLDGVERALLCQRAENEFVGMRCGIMDQFVISLGEPSHALLIDCRSLDYRPIPLPGGCSVVVCDTNKRRGLVDSEYNRRREECERGAALLGVAALRDVTPEAFAARADELDPLTHRRCRHVVTENQRVLDSVAALERGDLVRFGELMVASHASLRNDYEVSCFELDVMVEAALKRPGVLGSRMTGAGFGGCTVSLVEDGAVDVFVREVPAEYRERTGLDPEVYVCRAVRGAHRVV